jgi:hypothetical protein
LLDLAADADPLTLIPHDIAFSGSLRRGREKGAAVRQEGRERGRKSPKTRSTLRSGGWSTRYVVAMLEW